MSGLVIALLNSRSGGSRQIAAASASIPLQNGGLGLRIQVQGNDFLITWDRDAPALRAVTKGVLRIQDGSEHRSTELQPAELANGSIIYRPHSDDVDFLLTVYAADGAVTRESVRAVDGTSGAKRDQAADVEKAAAAPQAVPVRRPEALRTEPRRSAVQARGREPVGKTARASDYVAPQPLRVVMPDVARLAAESLPSTGKIDVEVTVDEHGHVRAARIPEHAPSVSSAAARAAIAAAKQWRFEPAKLQGKPVASKHHIIFNIQPGAR